MKVRELIAELQKFNPELEVCMTDDSYDAAAVSGVRLDTAAAHDMSGSPDGAQLAVIW